MTEQTLTGRKILILASQGVEEVELTSPRDALTEAGASVTLASPDGDEFQALNGDWDRGQSFQPDSGFDGLSAEQFDGLVLPGGTLNADRVRQDERAQALVREFLDHSKPVAAICHAPWLLIDSGVAEGRTLTSFASVAPDLKNAGATWLDEEVVLDDGLITSRNPGDLDAFNRAIVNAFQDEDASEPTG